MARLALAFVWPTPHDGTLATSHSARWASALHGAGPSSYAADPEQLLEQGREHLERLKAQRKLFASVRTCTAPVLRPLYCPCTILHPLSAVLYCTAPVLLLCRLHTGTPLALHLYCICTAPVLQLYCSCAAAVHLVPYTSPAPACCRRAPSRLTSGRCCMHMMRCGTLSAPPIGPAQLPRCPPPHPPHCPAVGDGGGAHPDTAGWGAGVGCPLQFDRCNGLCGPKVFPFTKTRRSNQIQGLQGHPRFRISRNQVSL